MTEREARIEELRAILVTHDGLAKIIEIHVLVCGHYPRMELSPRAIIEAIADCEFEARIGRWLPTQ